MIPIFLLFLELVVTCFLCFRNIHKRDLHYSAYLPLIITNLGVTNVGMLGANEFIYTENKESSDCAACYFKEADKFIKISSSLSFVHHCVVITTILGLVAHNPCYFEHWDCPNFILQNYEGYYHDNMYIIIGGIIGLGIIGLLSTLRLGARSLKIVVNT